MMKLFTCIVCLLLLVLGCTSASQSAINESVKKGKEFGDVILTTALGKVRGTYMTSRLGRIFYAFRGMRYAKPPVGDLRFRAPEPIEQWNGIFDATTDGPRCPQPTDNLTDVSEDCLRINVYSHGLSTEQNENVRKPVIVYLHPGGFYGVSGQSWNFAGPQAFMDRDIVLVTINYRLGTLGFMSTGTPEVTGNAGLKDQVMALKWIKLHIAKFGGDPNSITLLGYSAGAVSITLHMVSPMSRNLFHKAIVMSGSGVSQWQLPTDQLDLARRQARLLNCTDANIKEMVDCLRTKDAVDFGKTLLQMFEFGVGNPVLLFKPVLEPDFGQERFLEEDPTISYQRGRVMRIPVIAGITKDEFVDPAIGVLSNSTLRNQMETDFNTWGPVNFLYERETKRSNEISVKLQKFYLGDGSLHPNRSLEALSQLYADGLIGFGMHRFVRLAARLMRVYHYRFSYQGRRSHTYYPDDKPYGVVHHDDLIYLFVGTAPMFTPQDPESVTVERLTRMWTAFAYKGDPNKPNDEYLQTLRWRPFGFVREQYLDIGDQLIMKEHLYTDRYNVWKELFPLSWPPARRNRKEENNDNYSEDYPQLEDSAEHPSYP